VSQARRCVGAILAGGAASRMGGAAKGLERVGGARMIDRVARAIGSAADEIVVVANADRADTWMPGGRVVADRRLGAGALGGIDAALAAAAGGDVLVLAWDTPFVPGALLRALREAGELHGAIAAAPSSASPWGFEPLCCWLSAAAHPHVERLLDADDGRVGALATLSGFLTVDASSWGDPRDIFFNVNTPADLANAQAIAARLDGAS
jgi:molybdopterin-guanine dinucleotide biosynthesis protein A